MAPELTPSATTNSGAVASSSALCQSSLTACCLPREDATAASSRIQRDANTASRTMAASEALSRRAMRTLSGLMRDSSAAASGATRQDQRARSGRSGFLAELERLPRLPAKVGPGPVNSSLDADAVIAVNDDRRPRIVQRDDLQMAARHLGVSPVDDERLTARATDAKRHRA